MLKGQYRFLAANSEEIGVSSNIKLSPSDQHKLLNVLRATAGMEVNIICRATGKVFLAKITETQPELKINLQSLLQTSAPALHVQRTLIALCKGEKNDFICQKATELGVGQICFFQAERSISKIDAKDQQKKLERWQKISEAALQQSGQNILPEIHIFKSLEHALENIPANESILFGLQTSKNILKLELDNPLVNLIIGPEGGLSPREIETLEKKGSIPVALSRATLRAETAFILALGCLNLRLQQDQ